MKSVTVIVLDMLGRARAYTQTYDEKYCTASVATHDLIHSLVLRDGDILQVKSSEEYDPTPWCSHCRAATKEACKCGPIAENE